MSRLPRTIRTSLTFLAPFRLPDFALPLPAGTYAVDTEEEAIEGNGHTVFRRVATTLVVQSGGRTEYHPVLPGDLEIALRRDQKAGDRLAEALTDESATPVTRSTAGWLPRWLRPGALRSHIPGRHSL